MSATLVQTRDLCVRFPARANAWGGVKRWVHAVDGIDLDVERGATLGLVGESGCGKSTLGRAMLRLLEPTAGSVSFDGMDLLSAGRRQLRSLRRHMQIVFQDPMGSLNPRMRVGHIVGEPLAVHGMGGRRERTERVAVLLGQVGLSAAHANRYPHEFSGGQRQRIGIARAIALQPKFIVCDEPVSALDVSVQAQVLNLLADLKASLGLTFLFIAHNLAVVRQFCERVAVMYLGRIVEEADSPQLFADPRHPYTRALWAAAPDPDRRGRVVAEPATNPIDPPSPLDVPGGCAFFPRCRFATDLCRRERPELRALDGPTGSHRVACHHAETLPAL